MSIPGIKADLPSWNSIDQETRTFLETLAEAKRQDYDLDLPSDTGTQAATTSAWTHTFYFDIVGDSGLPCWWAEGLTITCTVADTSTAGTATLADSTPSINSRGRGSITVNGDAAAWVAAETVTVTVASSGTLGGKTLTSDDYVITIT